LIVVVMLLASPYRVESGGQGAAKPQEAGSLPNFTGKVASLDASDLRGVRFRYEAGARSYWHTHDGALVILIEQGRGRMQLQGQKVQDILPGQPVVLPADVPHWHGAAPTEGLTWIALSVGRDVKAMRPVSDDEYLGRK
jgi:quercetin dioxygenase-like cupin family protein